LPILFFENTLTARSAATVLFGSKNNATSLNSDFKNIKEGAKMRYQAC